MRLLQTILAGLVLLTMLGAMVSSVLISREVFAFLPSAAGEALAGRCTFCAPTGALCCSRCIWASIGGA